MTLDASGNLGVGTTSPGAKLDVSSTSVIANFTHTTTNQWAVKVISSGSTELQMSGAITGNSGPSIRSVTSGGAAYAPLTLDGSTVTLKYGGTTGVLLDSSGNLGLGVTPSAWQSAYKALEVGNSLGIIGGSNAADLLYNAFINSSGNLIYRATDTATYYSLAQGKHRWGVAPSGTAGNAITFTTAMTLDASGNLGLGVTPSAWGSTFRALQIARSSLFTPASGGSTYLDTNAYFDSVGYKYIANGFATEYAQVTDGSHRWYTAPSGTINTAISFTQAMTLDANGNLFCGGTTGSSRLNLQTTTNSSTDSNYITLYNAGENVGHINWINGNGDLARITGTKTGAGASANDGILTFSTALDSVLGERGRFTAGGYFKASNTGGYDNATGPYHELLNNDASDAVVLVTHFGATNPLGIGVAFTAASPDDNTQYFLRCADSTTARCFIYSDGDLANHDGVYGTISDERLKQDIVDAPSQWNDLKAVRFRKYRMKTDVEANPDAPALLGVVAQELEQTSPGLIDEHPNEDGTTTKTVKSSILLMKAAVALQEAMARIEQLEAKVAALEAK